MMASSASPRRERWVAITLAVLLSGRLLLGLAYSVAIPLGEAPDEADHAAYAAFILQEGRLPTAAEATQAKHPPLHHLLAALAARPAGMDLGFLRSNPDVGVSPDAQAPNFFVHTLLESWPWRGGALGMHLGRLTSVLAGVLLILATYGLGRALWPGRPEIALAGAAIVGFLPESLFIGGAMSNDLLASLLATLALWGAVAGRGWAGAAATGAFMGLGMVTKASSAAVWPVVGAAMLLAGGDPAGWRLQRLGRLCLAGVLAGCIAAPWLWRNWQLYGDPMGAGAILATVDLRADPLRAADLWRLVRGWFASFWGKFGGAGQLALPASFYVVWGGLILAAAAGWARQAVAVRRVQGAPAPAGIGARWVVLAGTPVLVMISVVLYSRIALGTDQGRLLFPALAPVGLWLAGGLAAWAPLRRPQWLAWGAAGSMAIIGLLALVVGIIRPYAPPSQPSAATVAAAEPVGREAGGIELVASSWGRPVPLGDETVCPLTLYWRAARPVDDDLRASVRLLAGDGELVWEWKRSPGAGRFSTDRWPVGRVVEDVHRVPCDAPQRAARAEARVYAFPDETPVGVLPLTLPP